MVPSWSEVELFPQPLTPGERAIVGAYERLALQLEANGVVLDIYVQPYLENLRPDLVVSRRGGGVLIIEVKDWLPGGQDEGKRRRVLGAQLEQYRSALLELCLGDVELDIAFQKGPDQLGQAAAGLRQAVKTAAYHHGYPERGAADRFRHARIDSIIGSDFTGLPLPPAQIAEVPADVASHFRTHFKAWMCPPFHRADQARNVRLTPQQREYGGEARPRSWRRLQGPAGSGKSIVLAYKAALYASVGKTALLVSYNKTLTSYLRDLVARMPFEFDWTKIQILNFHQLLRRIRLQLEETGPYRGETDISEYLDTVYPECVAEWLDDNALPEYRYDAVLIDEGQDSVKAWLGVLGRCCGDGELLVVRDLQQNIYGSDPVGLEDSHYRGFSGLRGFSGPWGNLETSYRMSPDISQAVSRFAEKFQHAKPFVSAPERGRLEFGDHRPFRVWDNLSESSLVDEAVRVVSRLAGGLGPAASHPSDLAVVCFTNDMAFKLVSALEAAGFRPLHVYDADGVRVPGKLIRFHRGDGRIKVITGHSFKGFEVFGAVVCVSPGGAVAEQAAWIYTAMRGALEGLWVLNADSRFDSGIECFKPMVASSQPV